MSKKSKSQKHGDLQRKRELRARHRKEIQYESYFEGDETYPNFSAQLQVRGLQLREIPGDGNCLFRALADQTDGSSQNHLHYRHETVDYMIRNREDFEPFVEDDMPFEQYINRLRKPGTYAGNDAVVAFARCHTCKVVIHQLNAPTYQIIGSDHPQVKELHISYHNGDHYASIRRNGDNSNLPANIKFMPSYQSNEHAATNSGRNKGKSSYLSDVLPPTAGTTIYPDVTGQVKAVRDMADVENYIMSETGNNDCEEIRQVMSDNDYDVDNTITYLLQLDCLRSPSCNGIIAHSGSGSKDEKADSEGECISLHSEHTSTTCHSEGCSSSSMGESHNNNNRDMSRGGVDAWSGTSSGYSSHTSSSHHAPSPSGKPSGGAKPKLSNKQRKEQARLSKKKKQEDRHRQRHMEQQNGDSDLEHVNQSLECLTI